MVKSYRPEEAKFMINGKEIKSYIKPSATDQREVDFAIERYPQVSLLRVIGFAPHFDRTEREVLAHVPHDLYRKIHGWLDRIRYKPNLEMMWEFRTFGAPSPLLVNLIFNINFIMHTIDAEDHHKRIEIAQSNTLMLCELERWDFDQFVRWIRTRIHTMELHEADEFLKVDGVALFNPHGLEKRT